MCTMTHVYSAQLQERAVHVEEATRLFLVYVCGMTHLHVCHNTFVCSSNAEAFCVHAGGDEMVEGAVTHLCVWQDCFVRVP